MRQRESGVEDNMRLHWLAIAACVLLGACVPYGYYGGYAYRYPYPYPYAYGTYGYPAYSYGSYGYAPPYR